MTSQKIASPAMDEEPEGIHVWKVRREMQTRARAEAEAFQGHEAVKAGSQKKDPLGMEVPEVRLERELKNILGARAGLFVEVGA